MIKPLAFLVASLLALSITACSAAPNPSSTSIIESGKFTSASGEVIRAEYREDQTVLLTLANGETKTLRQAVSGSGVRYVMGADEWWEHQGGATLSQNGTVVFSGKLTP